MGVDASQPIDLRSGELIKVGNAAIEPASRIVRFGQNEERLQPQNLKVLLALARSRGEVVTRENLIDACWDGRVIGDDVINRAISTIRQVATRAGGFAIQTVPRTGYRLIETEQRRRLWPAAGTATLVLLLAACLLALKNSGHQGAGRREDRPTIAEEREALRTLDLKGVERLLERGWNANAPMDEDGNTPLAVLVNDCE